MKEGVARSRLPEIKQLMVGDRLIVFTDSNIYTNASLEEAYVLHRSAEQLGRELFRTGAAISFKEKAGFTDMMFYKTLILP